MSTNATNYPKWKSEIININFKNLKKNNKIPNIISYKYFIISNKN